MYISRLSFYKITGQKGDNGKLVDAFALYLLKYQVHLVWSMHLPFQRMRSYWVYLHTNSVPWY